MNTHLRRTLIALAVVSIFGAAQVYAHDDGGSSGVKISKKIELKSDINIHGDPRVDGKIEVNAAAAAVANGTQSSFWNSISNDGEVVNSANISGNVGNGVSGNVGVNQAAGDGNQQGNQGAIAAAGTSASDAGFTFNCDHGGDCGGKGSKPGSMADAETFATQSIVFTSTHNHGTTNVANVSENAFANASGNIGVNQAAGDGNQQLNQLAAATAQNVDYAVATSTLDQEWSGNRVDNDPGVLGFCSYPQNTSNSANLSGHAFANASGNIGVNQAAGSGNMQSNSLAMGVTGP